MKNIALCLYGYYNNRADSKAGDKGYNYIKNVIYPHGNVDVFIHSWEPDRENQLKDHYNPKEAVFEAQIDFEERRKKVGIDVNFIDQGFNRQKSKYAQCSVPASLSFFFSRGKSISLLEKHCALTGNQYDIAIVARFDLGQRSRMHKGYNVSTMDFDPTLDMDYIYSSMWAQLNAGYADQWFFSSPENIFMLQKMYVKSIDYFKPNSEYQNAITAGWFDSNKKNEFSNEILKPIEKRSKNLIKYPRYQMINNHIMHKWFFKDVGLYEKSKFV